MNQQEFIEDVKKRLGEELPDDLVFEVKGEYVSFYNKPTPELNSVLIFDKDVSEMDYRRVIDIIKTFHTI